uniref:Odorant receptor n=1 Tax=Phlebotomus papatasi TaxID=29031 RepID=A0A3F2ZEN6_PHLPP
MILKDYHEGLKKYILFYFSLYEVQFISLTNCSVIDKGKVLIFPLFLGVTSVFAVWHIFFQMASLDNIMDFTYNFNLSSAGFQTIITLLTILSSKTKFLTILEYLEDISTSNAEYFAEARENYLKNSISIAWHILRIFFIVSTVASIPVLVFGLYQTDFVSPLYYKLPGLSSNSTFYYPANIILQPIHYFLLMETIVATDLLIIIYLFYFRGEFYVINAVAELLTEKSILETNYERILLMIHKAHTTTLTNYSILYDVLWHFYCQKFFVVTLYLCASIFVFMKVTNSSIIGIILLAFVIAQLLLLCVPGQLIYNCSELLRNTLYSILWYEMKLKDQKDLLTMMITAERTIQPGTIAIGQISIITFVQVNIDLLGKFSGFAHTLA